MVGAVSLLLLMALTPASAGEIPARTLVCHVRCLDTGKVLVLSEKTHDQPGFCNYSRFYFEIRHPDEASFSLGLQNGNQFSNYVVETFPVSEPDRVSDVLHKEYSLKSKREQKGKLDIACMWSLLPQNEATLVKKLGDAKKNSTGDCPTCSQKKQDAPLKDFTTTTSKISAALTEKVTPASPSPSPKTSPKANPEKAKNNPHLAKYKATDAIRSKPGEVLKLDPQADERVTDQTPIYFLVDQSNSMNGANLASTARLILNTIRSLPDGQPVNIIHMSPNSESLSADGKLINIFTGKTDPEIHFENDQPASSLRNTTEKKLYIEIKERVSVQSQDIGAAIRTALARSPGAVIYVISDLDLLDYETQGVYSIRNANINVIQYRKHDSAEFAYREKLAKNIALLNNGFYYVVDATSSSNFVVNRVVEPVWYLKKFKKVVTEFNSFNKP